MTKDDKPDACEYGPGSRPNAKDSDRRVEVHLAWISVYTHALSAKQFGELMRMLFAEAAGQPVETSDALVQRAWARREEYRRIAGSFARAPLSLTTRRAIYERDGRRCTYCQAALTWPEFQCDHIFPASLGGSDDPDNLTASCRPCNRSKSAKPLSVWRQ